MPGLEHTPDYWIDTEKMIDELLALRQLRQACEMHWDSLPVEVHRILSAFVPQAAEEASDGT